MPSPDQSGYTTLILHDKSPYEILQTAITNAQLVSDWVPRSGDPLMAVAESISVAVSETIFAINRLPDAIMEVQMANFGIVRELGTPPSGTVEITVIGTTGYSIGAGTQFRLGDASNSIFLVTDSPATIAPGANQTTVAVTGLKNTSEWNGTPEGTSLALISPVPFIQSATLASDLSGGEGPESDDEWRSRGVQLFRSLNASLVLPDQFSAKALTYPGVERATTKDLWDGVEDEAAEGHVTVAVADSAGAALSSGDKTALQALLDSQSVAGLTVTVVDPTFNEVKVTTTVVAKPGYTTIDVQTSVTTALQEYLSPATWGWGDTVYINELISLIDQVDGVQRVASVTAALAADSLSTSDVVLEGTFPLVESGTILVTAT